MKLFQGFKHRPSKTQERNELISSSLVLPSMPSERVFAWSGSKNRERLTAMRFHKEWRHDDCPVMQWYEQQRVTSTIIQSIEHRRDVHGPFYHEFLLLMLADGSTCRVERVGEGSRTDAIRQTGCTSHDLIQWFPASRYASAMLASELIAEIDLVHDFDILDVLAICYAIQKTSPCSVYTLQRYNCYFLCLTILAVLTRRVASWEDSLTSSAWDSCAGSVLTELLRMTPEEANKHAMLRLCHILTPGYLQPEYYLIDILRQYLTGNPQCLAAYNQAMTCTIWFTSWEPALSSSLRGVFLSATAELLEGKSRCGAQLRSIVAMAPQHVARTIASNKQLASHYVTVQHKAMSLVLELSKTKQDAFIHMKQLKCPVPLHKQLLGSLIGKALAAIMKCAPVLLIDNPNDPLNKYNMLFISKLPFVLLYHNLLASTMSELGYPVWNIEEFAEIQDTVRNTVSTPIHILAVIDTLAADIESKRRDLQLLLGSVLDRESLAALPSSLVLPDLVHSLSITIED